MASFRGLKFGIPILGGKYPPFQFERATIDGATLIEGSNTATLAGSPTLGGGKLALSSSTPSWTNANFIHDDAYTRAAGLALVASIEGATLGQSGSFPVVCAWAQTSPPAFSGTGADIEHCFYNDSSSGVRLINNEAASSHIFEFAANTRENLAVILRSTGAFFLRNQASAGWKLVWIDSAANTSTLYATTAPYQQALDLYAHAVKQFTLDFETALKTDEISGSVSAGATFTHEADCWLEFDLDTTPSVGDRLRFAFRWEDDNNCWLLWWSTTGVTLYEYVASVATGRGSATIAAGVRVKVLCSGTTIKVYADDVLKITYASATNFQTATAGKRGYNNWISPYDEGGTISDFISRPYDAPDTIASALSGVIE